MPVVRARKDQVLPRVVKDGKMCLPFQISATTADNAVYTIPIQPSAPTNAFSTGAEVYYDLENDTGLITDLFLRFSLAASGGAVEVVPVAYFIDWIIIESSRSGGDELCRIYPETILAWNQVVMTHEARHRAQHQQGYKMVDFQSEKTERFTSTAEQNTVADGETKDFQFQLPTSIFQYQAFDMKHNSPLRLRIKFSNDIVVSGSVSNLSLSGVHLIAPNARESMTEQRARLSLARKYPAEYIYLDSERYQINDKTLTAGSTSKLYLDTFMGKCPFIVVFIKDQTQAASSKTRYKFNEVGHDTTFDLQNSAGSSLLSEGTPIKENYLYDSFVNETNNPALKGMYVIQFCEPGAFKQAFSGQIRGYKEFTGSKDQLAITLDSAPVQEVHTLTQTNAANDGGFYRFNTSRGNLGVADLAHSANTTAMKAAIEAIPEIKERGYTVSVNQDMASGTGTTITFGTADGRVSQEVGVVNVLPFSLNDGGVGEQVSSAVSTFGRRGWTTSSTKSVELHAYFYKKLTINPDGSCMCSKL